MTERNWFRAKCECQIMALLDIKPLSKEELAPLVGASVRTIEGYLTGLRHARVIARVPGGWKWRLVA